MSERLTVHTWGFVNEAGDWIAGDGVAISSETVRTAWERLERHHHHFDREPEKVRSTRTLDGWLVGVEFEVADDGTAARMWHRIFPERDSWPDFNDIPSAPPELDATTAECLPAEKETR